MTLNNNDNNEVYSKLKVFSVTVHSVFIYSCLWTFIVTCDNVSLVFIRRVYSRLLCQTEREEELVGEGWGGDEGKANALVREKREVRTHKDA